MPCRFLLRPQLHHATRSGDVASTRIHLIADLQQRGRGVADIEGPDTISSPCQYEQLRFLRLLHHVSIEDVGHDMFTILPYTPSSSGYLIMPHMIGDLPPTNKGGSLSRVSLRPIPYRDEDWGHTIQATHELGRRVCQASNSGLKHFAVSEGKLRPRPTSCPCA